MAPPKQPGAWMPRTSVEISDSWGRDPSTLTDGVNVKRVVTLKILGADPGRLPAVLAGQAGVQDEGSQLVVAALSRVATVGTDTGVSVDLCAGPGGKTALLAGLLPRTRLVAVEPRATRALLVAAAVARPAPALARIHI